MNLIQLQPDDVLVVSHPSHLTRDQRGAAIDMLRSVLGEHQQILVLDAGQTIDVLRGVAVDLTDARTDSAGGECVGGREVQHVDTDEPEAEGIPPHVWLYRNMLTDMQALAPLGRDETNGQYAVAIDDLTDDQRAIPHVRGQIVLRPDGHGAEARDLLRGGNT